jgi:hypothetical protein
MEHALCLAIRSHARPLGVELDGAIYRGTSQGNSLEEIVDDVGDRKIFSQRR